MKFTRVTFAIAGVYGLLVLLPLHFAGHGPGVESPSSLTHDQLFFGLIGVFALWQVLFLLIAAEPSKFKILIPFACFEKLAFVLPCVVLYWQQEVTRADLMFGLIDLVLAAAFLVAMFGTRPPREGGSDMFIFY
jgi:hypothetical protein